MSAEARPSAPLMLSASMNDVVELMRTMSRQTDPQEMVRIYRDNVRRMIVADASFAISRRDLSPPQFRVTRDTRWSEDVNPWKQKDKLPLLSGGILADLLYGDEPRIFDDLRVDPSDPAFPYFDGYRSAFAQPQYDGGVGLNMVVTLKKEPYGFDHAAAPTVLWLTNLFGRATGNLVLKEQLRQAYEIVDRELQAVAEIQRSLLPPTLPDVKGLRLSTHYQTSAQAGGDYYDLFNLPDGKLGMLIADVSGHGTPAAVVMAITHTVAHSIPGGPPAAPESMLSYLNDKLADAYQRTESAGFVTAFYGIFDPATRTLTYSSAGHNPPRLRRAAGDVEPLMGARDLPLGIAPGIGYGRDQIRLERGDLLVLYTDGITEAQAPGGELFGEQRLDAVLGSARTDPGWAISAVLDKVREHTQNRPATDDRTIVAAEVHA